MARTEKVTITNMCMVYDGDKVLVQAKTDDDYRGITFPGGHVEMGESFTDATAVLLSNILVENAERILHFFQLEKLSHKVDIIIYLTIDAYIKHVNDCGQTYYEWMIADTFDGKINITTMDLCNKTDAHKNMSFEDYTKLIIHEFVHICQQQVNPDSYGCEWFWEALATNLAGQEMAPPITLCTKEELMFRYAELPNAYSISYHMGRYLLQNLSHEKIYEYICKPDILRQDTEKLLMEMKENKSNGIHMDSQ